MSSTPKKRGAPPGNHNALRHGAYARRLPAAQADETPQEGMALARDRLSLIREISYLRAYFIRLALSGARDYETEKIAATVRTLSLVSVAITRLIQTESWLALACGDQVQYDYYTKAASELNAVTVPHYNIAVPPDDPPESSPSDPPASSVQDPAPHSLIPGLNRIARQLGIPASDLLTGLYTPSPSDASSASPPPA